MDVRINTGPSQFDVTAKTRVVLDRTQLIRLVYPAPCHVLDSALTIDGWAVYRLRVPRAACPWRSSELERVMQSQFLAIVVHDAVYGVDGRLFPNPATEVVFDLMRLDTPAAKAELQRLARWWGSEIHSDRERLNEKVVPWPLERDFFQRLEDRMMRRSELIAWARLYFSDGLEAAVHYAEEHRLI